MSHVASNVGSASQDSLIEPTIVSAPPMAAPQNKVSSRTVYADFIEPTQDFPQGRLAFRYQPSSEPNSPIYDSEIYDASKYMKVTTVKAVNVARAIDAANRIQELVELNAGNPQYDLTRRWTKRLSRAESHAFATSAIDKMF